MKKIEHQILRRDSTKSYNIPLYLEANAEELGIMVGFDGDIEQEDKECNFVYTSTGNTITVWNTTSTNRLKRIVDASFSINWGDGTTSGTTILGNVTKAYSGAGEKTISITMISPWITQTTTKKIVLPKDISDPTDLLNFTYTGGTLHYYDSTSQDYLKSGRTQNYGKSNQYEYTPNSFTGTTTFLALGKSRVIEKKLYGGNTYSGTTTGTTTIDGTAYTYTGYSIDSLNYLDLSDGSTYITGNTANFPSETQFTKCLTRNEHYLGFVSDPIIYSDVFVERGKMGVSEFNLRLGEIDNLGELDVYGNGFFNVKNQ